MGVFEDFDWQALALALGPALGALGAYELLFVWPLRRRLARLAAEIEGLARASAAASGLDTRLGQLERRAGAELIRLEDRLGRLELNNPSPAYERAIDLAAKGGGAKRLVSYFGLSEGEATLVRLLHGKRQGPKSDAKMR